VAVRREGFALYSTVAAKAFGSSPSSRKSATTRFEDGAGKAAACAL
jgi:hypothetical protein